MSSPDSTDRRILIVAAEASSCRYAERLLEHWRDQGESVKAFGVGNRAMEALGFECFGRAEDLAVVGLQEVFSHWSVIKKAYDDLVLAVQERKPNVVLLMDYPGFNLRFAKRMQDFKIPVVYYISPQIWAWKTGRVHDIKKYVDRMLVVFPFEKDFYAKFGVEVDFVGHPLLDELKLAKSGRLPRSLERAKFGIVDDDVVLGLMPGSRNSELKHHLALQLQVARQLYQSVPRLKVMLMVAPNFEKERLQSELGPIDFPLILIKDEPFSMIDMVDVVLCASGTATLMVGLAEKPMVIMYRMNPVTAFFAKMFVKQTAFFGLINLVLGRKVVPELFQEQANSDTLVHELKRFLLSEDLRRETARELGEAQRLLGDRGATLRVAKALQKYWRS